MRRRVALLLLMAIIVLAAPAMADESGLPRLGDHVFVPVLTLTEPFLVTHVQTAVGLGWTVNSTTPVISPVDSSVIGIVGSDQLLAGIGFQYQQGVKDWLVVRLAVDVIGRLGTDTNSMLADGVTGALGYDISWMMRIYRAQTVLVSGSVGLSKSNATFVNVLDWYYAQQAGEDASLVNPRTSLEGFGGLHAAWGINRRFGLLGSLYASYGESFDGGGANRWHSDVRAALSYNMAQDLSVPLGLALAAGRNENDANADSDAGTWFWSVRISEQGHDDFTIGLQLGSYYFDSAGQSDKLQFFDLTVDMRYYY